jgi:acetyltransferase
MILISAGFSELGAAGRVLEEEIRATARVRLRLIGPNCLGVLHPPSGLNASFAASMALPGSVALLSQNGAICTSMPRPVAPSLPWRSATRGRARGSAAA